MKQCPRCASEISNRDKTCPRCGLPTDRMEFAKELEEEAKSSKLNRAQKKEKRRLAKLEKKEAKRQKKLEREISSTDFSQFASKEPRRKNARGRRNDKFMDFTIDENGEFNIDTSDVEIIGDKTMKILEEKREQTYSVKKARGDYRPERIKWWEIYKLADRSFARRKIKKQVTKASRIKPDNVKKWKLFFLCLFCGWVGAHNFYVRNKRKGWTTVIFFSISCLSMIFSAVPFIKAIELWLIGFTGFVVMFMWMSDLVNILFGQFSYRIQKDKFISSMNVTTRAKLGEKYIDLDLLKRPWWVRLNVWWKKKRNNYKEWQKERRQYLIEKEKRKLAKKEEQAKIDAEIAEFEEKENVKFAEEKRAKLIAENEPAVEEVKEASVEEKEEVEEKPESKKAAPKKTASKKPAEKKTEETAEKAPEKKVTKASLQKSKYSTRNNTKKNVKKK